MPQPAKDTVHPTTTLLIVDDDPGIRELTAAFLHGHGYRVDTAADGATMRAAMATRKYDLIVLDVMMPGEDGLSILRSMDRSQGPAVIMQSVIGTDIDRIVGLEMGADDYIAKPANPRELLARIRSVLRRATGGETAEAAVPVRHYHRFAGWRLDATGRQLFDPDDVAINLSDGEFRLLLALIEHPRRVLSRDQLLDLSRGVNAEHFDRAIDVQMSRLRRKLARDGREELIRTIRNEGYLFTAEVAYG
ncbi:MULTISPECIES: response regulator [unclassified Sphingomonas]|uniref:response regulator n=1 Tax=unclassified Sphingomonas TaxID=196159 RepID=UPI0006FB26EB|nr:MULTISPECIES: response regulator transcription factor [unclassified Sphingomonas]KQM66299.1 two-component system response regulator [Sphingomonas sp. Leaf16]KQN08755.1 two-component system response regulator [Sphingomonas sp. Leaf29]KQN17336.1 two-component system response regulator [Sphingomonas sp. Leaf32]